MSNKYFKKTFLKRKALFRCGKAFVGNAGVCPFSSIQGKIVGVDDDLAILVDVGELKTVEYDLHNDVGAPQIDRRKPRTVDHGENGDGKSRVARIAENECGQLGGIMRVFR